MVVVIVLAILAATILPQFVGTTYDAKVARAKADLATVANQLELFKLHNERYPTSEEGLRILVEKPREGAKNWRPYLKELKPDPWGNPYQYRARVDRNGFPTYDIWSLGKDGTEGGEGENRDITNREEKAEEQ
jgi:general secretion pathway protein G